MNQLFESYIDERFVYKFTQGPDVVRSRKDALRDGLNCVSLAHLVLREMFDYQLPSDLFCTEMFYDREHFADVDSTASARPGDLIWLGTDMPAVGIDDFVPEYNGKELVNWSQFPVNHVAIATGKSADDDPLLLHSTHITGTNVIWPLGAFKAHKGHERVYGITRLKLSFNVPLLSET